MSRNQAARRVKETEDRDEESEDESEEEESEEEEDEAKERESITKPVNSRRAGKRRQKGAADGEGEPTMDWEELEDELARLPMSFRQPRFQAMPHVVEVLNASNPEQALEMVRQQQQRLEELTNKVVEVYYAGFNNAMHDYATIISLFSENERRVQHIGDCLQSSKDQLSTRSQMLKLQWRRGVVLRKVQKLLEAIHVAAVAPDRIGSLISEKMFLSAAVIFENAQRTIDVEGLEEVGALRDLRIMLAETKMHLKRELLDEVMSNIFVNTRAFTGGRRGVGAGGTNAGKAGISSIGNVGFGSKMRGSSTEDSILRDAVAAARELGKGIDPDLFEKINESSSTGQHTLLANGRSTALGNSQKDMLRIIEALKLTYLLPVAKSHILKEIKQRMKVMIMAHIERYTVNWRKLMNADRGRMTGSDTKSRDSLLCSFIQDVFSDCLEVLGSVVTTFKAIQQMVLSCSDDEQMENDDGLSSTQCSYLAWADVQSECISVLKEILGISSHETNEYLEVNEAFEELDEENDESTIFSKIGGFFSSNDKEVKQRSKKFKSKLKFSFKSTIDGGGGDSLEDASISVQYDSESSYRRLLPHVGLMLAPQLYIHVKNFVKKASARLPQHDEDEGRKEIKRWLEREVLRLLLPQLERKCRSQIFRELEGSEPFSVSHVKSRVASAFEVRPSFRVVSTLLEIMDELHTHMLMMGLFKKEISQIVVDCHVLVLEAFQEASARILNGQRSKELAEIPLIEGLFLTIASYTSLGLGDTVDLSSVASFSSFGAAIQIMNLIRAERPLKKSKLLNIGGIVQLIYLATSSLRVVQNMEELGMVRSPQRSRGGEDVFFGMNESYSSPSTPMSAMAGALSAGSASGDGNGFNPFASKEKFSTVFEGLAPVVTQFQKLAGLCLRAARIELQMKVVYHVQSLPAVSFSCDELDIDQDDAHTRELSEIFSNVTEELREKTIQPVYDFCLAPLAETIAHEIICILPEIDTINANGILKMQAILLSLQRALGGFWNFTEREGLDTESNDMAQHFERVRRYYELLNLPGQGLILFAREEMDMYSASEYKNLLLANVEDRTITEEQREQLSEMLSSRSEQTDQKKRSLVRKSRRQSFREWKSVVNVSM